MKDYNSGSDLEGHLKSLWDVVWYSNGQMYIQFCNNVCFETMNLRSLRKKILFIENTKVSTENCTQKNTAA